MGGSLRDGGCSAFVSRRRSQQRIPVDFCSQLPRQPLHGLASQQSKAPPPAFGPRSCAASGPAPWRHAIRWGNSGPRFFTPSPIAPSSLVTVLYRKSVSKKTGAASLPRLSLITRFQTSIGFRGLKLYGIFSDRSEPGSAISIVTKLTVASWNQFYLIEKIINSVAPGSGIQIAFEKSGNFVRSIHACRISVRISRFP